jgi:hypothetical protein
VIDGIDLDAVLAGEIPTAGVSCAEPARWRVFVDCIYCDEENPVNVFWCGLHLGYMVAGHVRYKCTNADPPVTFDYAEMVKKIEPL